MLSYQHAFHAGNHADVIKHLCWLGVINSLKKKDKPFTLFDSHAGAGCYDFSDAMSSKNKEYETGISRIQNVHADSALLKDYLTLCGTFLTHNNYPGSPAISAVAKREGDTLHAMELHPAEFEKLSTYLYRLKSANTHVHKRDGYEGLRALTPPKPNRGAILIDPPYERASEYSDVIKGVEQVLKRWKQAQIVIWYPLLSARAGAKQGASEVMVDKLAQTGLPCFKAEIKIAPSSEDVGMYGSGVLVINPPWQLDLQLSTALDDVIKDMGEASTAELTWINQDT
ncbi:23S rRNA (adenine(2030)-N(6))-methyltransferase RlmJ [Alteromonas sp. 009811495]|uniref:23S rRNA (adenine(2030)-N(6))-methyltransferase RlmJ n=1 Tax=Alteromonas sp. 009811495 TaxID=3002962 RepID=UPI00237DA4D2|nr:23S rRNA (adenine(2030)-N(6))-methyltransferase RlmJ [Alteromonas sp. 009811495]WDT88045.1 23S rRNA (adenine(2030)-N(6))-methyltransferase RlmJ [Alteromonas sp. 009811495]